MRLFQDDFLIERDSLETFDRRLEAFCMGLEPPQAGLDLFIATHELLINSIAETKRISKEGIHPIHVEIRSTPAYLEAIVTDYGGGFDCSKGACDDPNRHLAEEGRGLIMVDLLTDFFVTRAEENGRMAYIIRKQI